MSSFCLLSITVRSSFKDAQKTNGFGPVCLRLSGSLPLVSVFRSVGRTDGGISGKSPREETETAAAGTGGGSDARTATHVCILPKMQFLLCGNFDLIEEG